MISNYLFSGILKNSYSLAMLSVSDNHIETLEHRAFEGLHMTDLNLQDNHFLSDIHQEAFTGATIETISLDRCNLTAISTNTLKPLKNHLKSLYWSNSLRSLRLPNDLFQGFHLDYLSLRNDGLNELSFLATAVVLHLDLSFNHLFYFDIGLYPGLTYTQVLNLRSTDLKTLSTSRDVILSQLNELDISSNQLRSLDIKLFRSMPDLRHLNIASNLITTFPQTFRDIFTKLRYLDLTGNKLICNCEMHWFTTLSLDSSRRVVIEGAHCLTEDEQANNETHLVPCKAPVILSLANTAYTNYELQYNVSDTLISNSTDPNIKCLTHRRNKANSILRESCDSVFTSSHDSSQELRIRCAVSGHPSPLLSWRICDQSISKADLHTWSIINTTREVQTNNTVIESTLMIVPYTCLPIQCIATNRQGKDKLTFFPCAKNRSREVLCADSSTHPSSIFNLQIQHNTDNSPSKTDTRLIAGISVAVALCGSIVLPLVLVGLWRYARKSSSHRKRNTPRSFNRTQSTRSHVCLVNQDDDVNDDIRSDEEECKEDYVSQHIMPSSDSAVFIVHQT